MPRSRQEKMVGRAGSSLGRLEKTLRRWPRRAGSATPLPWRLCGLASLSSLLFFSRRCRQSRSVALGDLGRQGLLDVGDEVGRLLDADREADEAIGDADGQPL